MFYYFKQTIDIIQHDFHMSIIKYIGLKSVFFMVLFMQELKMFNEAILRLKTTKYLIQGFIMFILFMIIYTIVDGLNMSYSEMSFAYGTYLVILNIITNIVMSLGSALLMNLSTIMVELKGKEGKSSTFGSLSVLFGILTYGCTSCVIAFFASVGIAFSVVALPLAGFPYKIISLLLVSIGLFWMYKEIENGVCKVK
jgi:hypothetical protein